MSDLFQTLEGALLQGDVTDDLVNQAFLDYLQIAAHLLAAGKPSPISHDQHVGQ